MSEFPLCLLKTQSKRFQKQFLNPSIKNYLWKKSMKLHCVKRLNGSNAHTHIITWNRAKKGKTCATVLMMLKNTGGVAWAATNGFKTIFLWLENVVMDGSYSRTVPSCWKFMPRLKRAELEERSKETSSMSDICQCAKCEGLWQHTWKNSAKYWLLWVVAWTKGSSNFRKRADLRGRLQGMKLCFQHKNVINSVEYGDGQLYIGNHLAEKWLW